MAAASRSSGTLVIPPSQFIDIDGKPVHWVDFGGPENGSGGGSEGAPTMVCVHGLGGSFANWLSFAPLMTDEYRVVAFDLAGNGRTPPAGRKADIRSNRRLVDGFIRAISPDKPVTLVGNSMGGLLSILQTARAPETVERLVLLDAAVPLPRNRVPKDPRFIGGFALMLVPGAGERVMSRRGRRGPEFLVHETLALVCHDPSRVDPQLLRFSEELAAERAGKPGLDKAFLGAARSLTGVLARPKRYVEAIMSIRRPTLVLFGEHDRLVPVAAGRALAAKRADWAFHVHPDLGHVPQLEDPQWTAQQIREWVAELS